MNNPRAQRVHLEEKNNPEISGERAESRNVGAYPQSGYSSGIFALDNGLLYNIKSIGRLENRGGICTEN